jgi:hypothetical protein
LTIHHGIAEVLVWHSVALGAYAKQRQKIEEASNLIVQELHLNVLPECHQMSP